MQIEFVIERLQCFVVFERFRKCCKKFVEERFELVIVANENDDEKIPAVAHQCSPVNSVVFRKILDDLFLLTFSQRRKLEEQTILLVTKLTSIDDGPETG